MSVGNLPYISGNPSINKPTTIQENK